MSPTGPARSRQSPPWLQGNKTATAPRAGAGSVPTDHFPGSRLPDTSARARPAAKRRDCRGALWPAARAPCLAAKGGARTPGAGDSGPRRASPYPLTEEGQGCPRPASLQPPGLSRPRSVPKPLDAFSLKMSRSSGNFPGLLPRPFCVSRSWCPCGALRHEPCGCKCQTAPQRCYL